MKNGRIFLSKLLSTPISYPLSHLSFMGLISETGFHCLVQDGFHLNPPASTFQDLGLKGMCRDVLAGTSLAE